MGLIFAKINF